MDARERYGWMDDTRSGLHWCGDYTGLKAFVKRAGLSGQWVDIQYGRQFICDGGGIMNWFGYGRAKRINFQGPSIGKESLITKLSLLAEDERRERDGGALLREPDKHGQ